MANETDIQFSYRTFDNQSTGWNVNWYLKMEKNSQLWQMQPDQLSLLDPYDNNCQSREMWHNTTSVGMQIQVEGWWEKGNHQWSDYASWDLREKNVRE